MMAWCRISLAVGLCLATSTAFAQGALPGGPAAAPAPAKPPALLAFNDAVVKAANDLLAKAVLPAGTDRIALVIDPLIDGLTGVQSVATRSIERRIVEVVRTSHSRFQVKQLTTAELAKSPVVLIGTLTPINNAGVKDGPKDAWWICLALADLGTGRIISKGWSRTAIDALDATPAPYFSDAPIFAGDAATDAYIVSCQKTKIGDPIDRAYVDRILAAALISDAVLAYDGKRYREAVDLFQSAVRMKGGDQLRALNGVYLANWRLGRRAATKEAFGKLVDYGLSRDKLAIKFLFRPGATQFRADRRDAPPYGMWIDALASRSAKASTCLEVTGHTSATGPQVLNERISMLRAEYVTERLSSAEPALANRLLSRGAGGSRTIVGTGKDDASDALDRRVEFKVHTSCV